MAGDGLVDERSATRTFRFHTVARTHVGTVRALNEDAYLDRSDAGLWAVADGMGGHHAGDVASRTLVEMLDAAVEAEGGPPGAARVVAALRDCNTALRRLAASQDEQVIGCTAVVLSIEGPRYDCAWAGDSRLYLLRGDGLWQVTRDHSYVQDLVDRGEIGAEDAERHPHANIVTRAVGAAPQLVPECVGGEVRDGDVFLLCSDGLTKALGEARLAATLAGMEPPHAADELVREALEAGARDNLTLVLVRCEAVARR